MNVLGQVHITVTAQVTGFPDSEPRILASGVVDAELVVNPEPGTSVLLDKPQLLRNIAGMLTSEADAGDWPGKLE